MTSTTTDTPTEIHDAEAVQLWGRVIKGFAVTNRKLHALIKSAFDLSEAEAETLLNLHRDPDHRAPMATLARAAAFTSGGYTKIADKLVHRGLVARVPCVDDRRITYLELTADGTKVATDLARLVSDVNRDQFVGVLGPERARMVAEAMTELYRANRDAKK
ncbi:MarR family winged helix-turn-helix transcriptional regulator [Promicromonospora sp. NFX87]|uniref:MarR family winged helix-turn-helix transcriptional regulator n=1 Tax=Promicromonospora sp. NFX87 TaxID=3402691 RepID=UPI003AFB7F60